MFMGLLAASPVAEAGNILRMGGSSGAAPGAASGGAGGLIPASVPASIASQNLLSRRTQALVAVQAMQYKANALATNNYLVTHAGLRLAPVPEGLVDNRPAAGAGGLIPDNVDPNFTGSGSYAVSKTWTGVDTSGSGLSQSLVDGQTTVTVVQNAQQALLNWQTFNVGRHTTLHFDQTAGGADVGKWIAFNKINSTGVPSQILGSIQAEGQVYIINPNGIIFGGSSQVNAHALVASSLPINDNLRTGGLLNNPDNQFMFSALAIPAGASGTPAFTPPTITTGTYGDVEIQPGATITAPTSAQHVGGLVALIGPNVYNGGTIRTEDGQTILAAGLQVGLAAHNTNDPTLRGLDVYVGAVADTPTTDPNYSLNTIVQTTSGTAGTATNDCVPATDINGNVKTDTNGNVLYNQGYIYAPRGNVTITGSNVNQLGVIDSSTSVADNGRVDLLANYNAFSNIANATPLFLFLSTGTVTLGPGSVTQILPELTGTDRVVGTVLSLPSLVNIQGQAIHLASDAAGNGAIIYAPNAGIMPSLAELQAAQPNRILPVDNSGETLFVPGSSSVVAGVSLTAGSWVLKNVTLTVVKPPVVNVSNPPTGKLVAIPGSLNPNQISLDSGATIDVSGSQNVSASVDENIVPVQLSGAQLANSPVQRGGLFYRQTVNVDIRQIGNYNGQEWAGTPLGDTTGYINLIQRSVGELTTNGGTVALNAGDKVTMSSGSNVNVSGGWISYAGGVVSTTKVMTGGHILDISRATPDLVYDEIYTGTFTTSDAKWGVTQTYTNPQLRGGGQYEQPYIQGGNAGSISITAPTMTLSGSLLGNTVSGPYQRTPLSQLSSTTEFGATPISDTMQSILGVPVPGALNLTFQSETAAAGVVTLTAPAATNIFFQSGSSQTSDDPQPLSTDVILSTDLVNAVNADNSVNPNWNGFGTLNVFDPAGKIYVQADINAPAGGDLELTGQSIAIDPKTNVRAPSGTLKFTVDDVFPNSISDLTLVTNLNTSNGAGQFTLGKGASLSTAGLIVDNRVTAAAPGTVPLSIDGGKIEIDAYRINLESDLQSTSTIDVSGGVGVSVASKLTYGKGGTLNINAMEPTYKALGLLPGTPTNYLGQLVLDPTTTILKGYSGKAGSGGTLTITAPFIQVGGDPAKLLNGDSASNVGRTFFLPEDASGNIPFFSQGGFSNFTLQGLGGFVTAPSSTVVVPFTYMPGVVIAPGVVINPQISSYTASLPVNGGLALTSRLLPVDQRTTAAQLTFNSLGVASGFLPPTGTNPLGPDVNEWLRGDLVVYPGAVIETDPHGSATGSVTLKGDTVTLLGAVNGASIPGVKVVAQGGTINIKGAAQLFITSGTPLFDETNDAAPTVYLEPGSDLDASGTVVSTTLQYPQGSRTTGNVLGGGSISVIGNIVAEAGATLNVNGATGQLDLLPAYAGTDPAPGGNPSASNYVPVREDSNGGTITLAGNEELFTNATLEGSAGGSTLPGGSMAQGGTLNISSGAWNVSTQLQPLTPTMILTQGNASFSVAKQTQSANGQTVVMPVLGSPVVRSDGAVPSGQGNFSAQSFTGSGFASLVLGSSVTVPTGATPTGAVQFSGPVTLTASNSLTIGAFGILQADPLQNSSLTLNAPYVAVGKAFLVPDSPNDPQPPVPFGAKFPPTFGSGTINIYASDLIEIGNLSLQNIGTANFDATVNTTTGQSGQTNGDIRGDGTLDAAGAINLKAGQVYVPTAVNFTVAAYDDNILVAASSSGGPTVTLASPVLPPGFGKGSPLLGSTVKSIGSDGVTVTLNSGANATIISNTPETFAPNTGSVTISPGPGLPALPLSAGGTLSIYAPIINQGGVLRAPIGTINLGWNGAGIAPKDPITGASVPVSQKVTLASGSWTSVSAVDPLTGQGLTIPYGINLNGTSWIDPSGTDITTKGNGAVGVGLPAKSVNISAANVDDQGASPSTGQPAAIIDLSGGGDLYAYRWVPGLGGSYDVLAASYDVTNSLYDIASTSASTSFAIIPGYRANFAPIANYATNSSNFKTTNPNPNDPGGDITDPGYTSNNLAVGQQVYLGASRGLPAGTYTLLPARYALLPGAFLVTPQSGVPTGTVSRAGGSSLVSGYQFNHFTPTRPVFSSFEVDPQSVVQARAEYDSFSANSFLSQSALAQKQAVPRLPVDSGQLVFNTTQALKIAGSLAAKTPAGGRGSLVDINTSVDILIANQATAQTTYSGFSGLVLDPTGLSDFGADSLLIGGVRSTTTTGTTVTVATNNLTVDNAGNALTGPDVILVANTALKLQPGADVEQGTRTLSGPADALQVGQQQTLNSVAPNNVFNVANGGSAIGFPQGTPLADSRGNASNDAVQANVAAIVTSADGKTTTNVAANTSFTVPIGGTVTLNSGGQLKVVSGSVAFPVFFGDGTLLRVSSDPSATISRPGVAKAVSSLPAVNPVAMNIGSGATIGTPGAVGSVTLDSTNATLLNTTVNGTAINLDSGQISLQLTNPGSLQTTTGLVLTNAAVTALQNSAIPLSSLSFLSYSSIDIYGTGQVGSPALNNLSLHAGEIRGFNTGVGTATFAAQNILLDNSASGTVPGPVSGQGGGALAFDAGAGTIKLGANQLSIDQYSAVNLNAGGGILVQGTGGLTTQGSLTMATPLLTGAAGANQTITTNAGALTIQPSTSGSTPTINGGLGASLTLIGAGGVAINSNSSIRLPSGTMSMEAKSGDVSVGGTLDVSGTEKDFFNSKQYTSGGQVTLTSDAGKVTLASGSTVNVSAQPAAGNAGSLTISAPDGVFSTPPASVPTLYGQGGVGGQGGTFSLDVGNLQGAGTNLDSLASILYAEGFTHSVAIRDRGDSLVTLNGMLKAHTVNLSADAGTIDIAGTIDASSNSPVNINTPPPNGVINWDGQTGGSINLAAFGDVKLEGTLNAEGAYYNDAGQGGHISIGAGTYTTRSTVNAGYVSNSVNNAPAGTVKINGGTINLKVDSQYTTSDLETYWTSLTNGGPAGVPTNNTGSLPGGGTLHLSAPQTTAGGVAIAPVNGTIEGTNASNIVVEGYKVYTPVNGVIDTIDAVNTGIVYTDAQSFVTQPHVTAIDNLFSSLSDKANIHVEPGAEIVNSTAPAFLTINGNPTLAPGASIAATSGTSITLNSSATGTSVSGGAITFNTAVSKITVTGSAVTITDANGNTSSLSVGPHTNITAGSTVNLTGAGTGTITLNGSATITNSTGNLALNNTWDLSTFRFGPKVNNGAGGPPNRDGSGEPGILTLRAAGNLDFHYNSSTKTFASLSDGFDTSTTNSGNPGNIGALVASAPIWTAQLMPSGSRSWAYNLVAGADLSAADSSRVLPLNKLAASTGSLLLGNGSPAFSPPTFSLPIGDANFIQQFYQVIRTGTGDINIFAGQDVQLIDSLAAIYTAGGQAQALANFSVPDPSYDNVTSKITAPNSFPNSESTVYPAQYSQNGGNVTISAQGNIIHETSSGAPDSSKELPTNWLYRRGYVNSNGQFDLTHGSGNSTNNSNPNTEIASTTWWVDFSNFFEGVGALGGGNITLLAGHDVSNVDAVVPTNARVTSQLPNGDTKAADQTLLELGGGDLVVQAGNNINGGVYYVERGAGTLSAGNQILTNSTRTEGSVVPSSPSNWMPTTLFLGQGGFNVAAGGSVLLGPVANPFLLPQGINNSYFDKTYFSTYATTDAVDIVSLSGSVTLQDNPANTNQVNGSLFNWYTKVLFGSKQSWLGLVETSLNSSNYFATAAALMPGTLQATAFSGNVNLVGNLTLSPSPNGTIDLAAAGSINGLQPNGIGTNSQGVVWGASTITLSDANPGSLPGLYTPLSLTAAAVAANDQSQTASTQELYWAATPSTLRIVPNGPTSLLPTFAPILTESGSFTGTNGTLQAEQTLHGTSVITGTNVLGPLHVNDTTGPIQLYAGTGDISGLMLFAGKAASVVAGNNITDVALYVQNDKASDVSVVDAGNDIIAYDQNSSLRNAATAAGNTLLSTASELGDIQIDGPGTLEVLAGRNLNLGIEANNQQNQQNGIAVGITSIGNSRNPALPFAGADVVAGAGLGGLATAATPGLDSGQLDFTQFNTQYPIPTSGTVEQQDIQALDNFYLVLRDAGRDFNNPSSPSYKKNYNNGFAAIADLFPGNAWQGDITLTSRDIKTENGGNIDILAPGGQLTVGLPVGGLANDQGILTVRGGNISIFANKSVNVGVSRIFTLQGGNEIIWSSTGNIAAGSASKTVQSAPPTRALIDPQSANVEPDPAGLATGGGIGALETIVGAPPANIDLIAPAGFVDAGDAGIRASGNLNISAVQVLNASNISVGGKSSGTPAPPAAPNIASVASASNTSSASSNAASEVARQGHAPVQQQVFPSIITVEVLGYGGGDS
jgi:filamentous hemagglutinin